MALNTAMLMELKYEAANTRKMLERVPLEKATWKPHEKSRALENLALHVAQNYAWVDRIMTKDDFDMAVPNAFPKHDPPKTSKELLDMFDHNVATATKALEAASDETMMKPWNFRAGEKVFMSLPKAAAVRNLAFNHHIHHRGQLSVYLRDLNVPVPGMYGPSADETM
jgi:uncharacterized damage-inducible protein DinB